MAKKSTIVMLLSNPFKPDPRVFREAQYLAEHGFNLKIIAWDRLGEFPERETNDFFEIIRIQNVPSTYYAGLKQIFKLPLFWNAAAKIAISHQPDFIHCHDLDTLYAGVKVRSVLGCKLIYDAHENYPAMMSLYLPKPMLNFLRTLEFGLMRKADHIITASKTLSELYFQRGFDQVNVIPNTPDLPSFDQIKDHEVINLRQDLGLKQSDLVIGYIGGFTKNRLLAPLIEAARADREIKVYIWGDGLNRSKIEELIQDTSNVHYLGWLEPNEIPLHSKMLDIFYYVIEPDYPGTVFNAPNSLGYAMAAGKPIIANHVGDLGDIVSEEKCGILLNQVTPESIQIGINRLRNEQIRHELGQAGRIAAEKYFNWETTGLKLLKIYLA